MSVLLRNLIHFGELLRALDLDVPAGRMLDVAAALDHVEIGRRTDFYFTLQSLLVHRRQDLATFDEAFRMFWRPLPSEWSPHDLRAMGELRRIGPPERETPTVGSSAGRPSSSQLQAGRADRALELQRPRGVAQERLRAVHRGRDGRGESR